MANISFNYFEFYLVSSKLRKKMLATVENLTSFHFELEDDFCEISKILGFVFRIRTIFATYPQSSFFSLQAKYAWYHADVKFVACPKERAA